MVKTFTDKHIYKYTAEVKVGNIASIKIAEHIGLSLKKEDKGILFYANF